MKRRWLLILALFAAGMPLALHERSTPALRQTAYATNTQEASKPLMPPARLRIRAAEVQAAGDALLDPDSAAWGKAAPTRIALNRTPRVYQTEPAVDRPVPALEVRAAHSGDMLVFRLQWSDATKNAPAAPERKDGEGGDPTKLYKRPTGATNAFPDAAAVMVPEKWTGPAFPALLMGDKSTPVRLYYWNASHGAEELKASGRATPETVGRSLAHRARHAAGKWTLTLDTPEAPDGYPLAFAVWDGQLGDRDGLKFFSIWYVLSRE
jgi:hypothetical protein